MSNREGFEDGCCKCNGKAGEMANVFQIVSVGKRGGHQSHVNGEWHVAINFPFPSTFCGITLEGDDDIQAGVAKEGRVTCQSCRRMLEEAEKIKNWR